MQLAQLHNVCVMSVINILGVVILGNKIELFSVFHPKEFICMERSVAKQQIIFHSLGKSHYFFGIPSLTFQVSVFRFESDRSQIIKEYKTLFPLTLAVPQLGHM